MTGEPVDPDRGFGLYPGTDSDEEVPGADVRSLSSESFLCSALDAGFTAQEVRQAEASLDNSAVCAKVSAIAS